jgi:hypothetical protein
MKATVATDAGPVEFTFSAYALDPTDAAGECQVALTVRRKPAAPPKVFQSEIDCLSLRALGFDDLFIPVADCGTTPEKAEWVFSGGDLGGRELPAQLEVLWCKEGEQRLCEIPCSPPPAK